MRQKLFHNALFSVSVAPKLRQSGSDVRRHIRRPPPELQPTAPAGHTVAEGIQ